MNGHMTGWISAYADGELHGVRRQSVEDHLATCADCRAELEMLGKLAALLQEAPETVFAEPAGQFAARVLRDLDRSAAPGRIKALKAGWQFAPLGLVAAWGFFQAVLFLAGLVDLGWLRGLIVPSQPAAQNAVASLWSALLALLQFGWLSALVEPFSWFDLNSPLLSILVLDLGLSVFTLILLGGWVASWWALRNSPQLVVLRSEERF